MELAISKKPLGLWSLTALVVGTMIGSGIFLLPAQLAKLGTVSLLSWCLTTIGAIFLGIILAKMSILVPRNGGPYAYARKGLGDFIGFQTAYTHWIALWVSIIALVLAMVSYLGMFFPKVLEPSSMLTVSIITIWVITIFNTYGAKPVGVFQIIFTILKVLPILAIIIFGLFYFNPSYLSFDISTQQDLTSSYSTIASAAGVTLWSFIGMEAATIPYEHIENPQKNIPRATILGILIASAIYIMSSIVVIGIIPIGELANTTVSPFIAVAELLFGPVGKTVIIWTAIISCLGCINGLFFIQGQITLAAADDDLFPSIFAVRNKNNIPAPGLIITAFIQTIVLTLVMYKAVGAEFSLIVSIASLASLIPYLYAAAASLVVFKEFPDGKMKNIIFICFAFVASIYSFWIITIMKNTVILHGSFLIFIGVILYGILYEKRA